MAEIDSAIAMGFDSEMVSLDASMLTRPNVHENLHGVKNRVCPLTRLRLNQLVGALPCNSFHLGFPAATNHEDK
ncbi:hypothetical protein Ae201684_015186 [Aphanomyces euteiches]|uniref:Uncharacterized protein n=1 Tax=Aphanomyces euteiches TaxID=100861 RepID=A0A6G0WHB0_9STRA|nr:hypothetical protein Ae201684_015186 [Aphanomyces euteiches]